MPAPKPTTIRLDIAADLNKWRTFLAIAELGSLTRAAIFLDSNQSLLSRQLNAMERDCGARLFNRTGRGVALSEVGERIFPHVKMLLEGAEQLENEVRGEAREPGGQVTVGSLPSISNPLVGRLFTRIRAAHPAVRLRILEGSSGQVEEWLADARVDIAILYRYGASLPEHEQSLATVDSYLIGAAGDKLTAGSEVEFARLDDLPFILPGAPNGLRNALDATARARHITLGPVIEADSLPLMKSLVANERLYTVLPLHAVWQEVEDGRLQATRIVNPTLQRTISMAMARSKGPGRAVAVVAREIVGMVEAMAKDGMWHSGVRA
jgi:DNA-binding transcriptional LysR family regulator